MLFLEKAIYDFLNADTELVALLSHTASVPKIFSSFPDKLAKYPCVAFWDESSRNQSANIDEIEASIINFGVFSGVDDTVTYNGWATRGKLLNRRISRRLQDILSPGDMQDANLSNSQVQIDAVLFVNRLPIRYEYEESVYRSDLTCQMNWYEK